MTEHRRSHWHADPEELERYVDDALEPARLAVVARHLAACADCRAEVERLRRSVAAMSLASRPPADLLDRIRARRAANERVILPVVEPAAGRAPLGVRPLGEEALDDGELHAARRVDAMLALASSPP